jgi:hypothetical protein
VASPSSAISLSGKLNEFSLPFCGGRVWLGASGLCQNRDGASPVSTGMLRPAIVARNLKLRRGFAASRSGKSAYF